MTIKTPSVRLPFWRQLRWNLIFYFVVLAIIPIVALTIIRFNQETQRSEEDAYSELTIAAELKQDQLRRWLDDSNAGLRLLAGVESPALLLASPDDADLQARVNEFLRQSIENYPNFEEFFLYTDAGQVIAGSNSNQLGKVVTRQPYFTASLQGNYIQPPYYDLATNALTIIITYPLRSPNNELLGVLAGRLNPQTLTTVMTGTRELGETGETYLVSRENNYFLTPSRFEGYELTRAYHSLAIDRALNGENGQAAFDDYRNPPVPVFGVYRWVPELQVGLIAQIDREEALRAAVNARNTSLIIASVAIVLAAVAGAYFATRVSKPITQLTETAARLAGGDFEHRATVTQAGEVGVLGETFNLMADQIRDMVANLENRVTERTKDLQATLEVGRIATSIAASHELLPRLVEAIRDQFDLYYAQIYLIDDVGRFAVLRAGTGTVGQRLLKQKHRLNLSETSIVARAVQTAQPVLVENTETSTIHLPNPLLPDTRSEVAFPLSVGGKILGVLDMQATQPGTFNEGNVPVFEAMATTLAGVLQSNAAFEEAKTAISRADAVNRRLVRQNWESYLGRVAQGKKVGYQYDLEAPTPLDEWTTLPDEAVKDQDKAHAILPIKLGDQKIGNILVTEEWQRDWAPEEMALIEDVAQRVAQAVEQLRAFDETETLANELAIVAEVSTRIASTLDPDELLQSVADVTRESFNLYHAHIYLLDSTGHNLVLAAGAGDVGQRMVAARHAIAINREHSLVARAARSRQVVISNNVSQEPDFLPNPLLPATKSELAAPIVVGNELLGVLDVQADVFNRFTEKDIQVNSTLAGQLAIALANARQFQAVERARQETERLYNSSIDMLGSANFAGYFVSLNPAWEQTLGYTRDELMARPFIEFVHPDDVAITNAEAARIAEGAKALSFINRYLAKDGTYRWIAWNAAPDMETSLIHFVARDITTQVEAEANLRKLSSAVEQSPSVVMITDTNGVIEYVNPAFTRITGYPPEAAVGQNPRLLKSDQTPAYRYKDMWNAILAGKEWRTEILNKRQNGELYWAELSIAPVKDAQGKITHFLGIHNDITERKQSEEALRQARAEAEVLYLVSSLINEAQNEQGIVDAVARYALADEISAVTLSVNDDVRNPTSSLVAADWRRDSNPSLVGLRVPTSDFLFLESLDRREVFYSSNINDDSRIDPQSRQALAAFGVIGLFFVPLVIGDQVLGTLSLSTDKPYQFSERDVRIFRAIAEQAAVTMERIELLKQTQKRAVELQVVAEVTAVAGSTLNRNELLQTFSERHR
jgi:PAS domain S-box-containing protein